ncbi:MAG: hypothetical protein PHT07_21005 [Paludibacter sp.]|nr:hypothetical protein [Paludibacter sp.]
MIQLLSVYKWILGHLKASLLIALILSFGVIYWLWQEKTALETDNSRISENFEQKDKQVAQMNLTIEEYNKLQTKDKATIDSLCKVIDKKPKDLKEATVINESFKDTNSVEASYGNPSITEPKPNSTAKPNITKPIYSIPVSFGSDSCWGMKGVIQSTDPKARLFIKERTFINSVQLIVIKKKKFLWWTIRKEQFKAFSNCEKELKVTKINFVKK